MSNEEPKEPLTPALQNPWYHLLTWYGEPEDVYDEKTIRKNRQFWYCYIYDDLIDDQKIILLKKKPDWEEVYSLFSRKKEDIIAELNVRLVENGAPENISLLDDKGINLSKTEFKKAIFFERLIFFNNVSFSDSTFSDSADFSNAKFFDNAFFRGSTFSDKAEFSYAKFSESANFSNTKFSGDTFFSNTKFSGDTFFNGSTFSEWVTFSNSKFSRRAIFFGSEFSSDINFNGSVFSGFIDFKNSVFKSTTDFTHAKFKKHPPQFQGSELHVDTIWDDVTWPTSHKNPDLSERVRAFGTLRHLMNKVQRFDAELDFLALELEVKNEQKRSFYYWFYNTFSDIGRSVNRPLCWMLFFIGLFAGLQFLILYASRNEFSLSLWADAMTAIKISVSNTFLFLTPWSVDEVNDLGAIGKTLSLAQSLISSVLIFLVGLGLRNKYRIR